MSKLAKRPSNVGLRIYHRGAPDETLMRGAWDPIIDEDTHERVLALLSDPVRKRSRPAAQKHLLTTGRLGVCGVCQSPLRVKPVTPKFGKIQVLYVCIEGCVGRNQSHVDHAVRAVAIARMKRPDTLRFLADRSVDIKPLRARVDAVRARLDTAADKFAKEIIDGEQLGRISAQLKPELASAIARLSEAQLAENLRPAFEMAGDRAEGAWDSFSVGKRQSVLHALRGSGGCTSPRRGPGFELESLDFRWGAQRT